MKTAVKGQNAGAEKEGVLIKKDKDFKGFDEDEMEQVIKWIEIIEHIDSYVTEKTSSLKILVRKGVPQIFRGFVWNRVLRQKDRKIFSSLYSEIVKSGIVREKDSDLIQKDVNRLHPLSIINTESKIDIQKWQQKITNILQATAFRFPEVGYVQGLGMIVRFLLAYMDEEDVFWAMTELIEARGLKTLYVDSFPGLRQAFYVHYRLLKERIPKVFRSLMNAGVKPSMYCANWFLTLFSGSWPSEIVARIWDIFFLGDPDIIHRAAFCLIQHSESILVKKEFEGIMGFLSSPWNIISAEEVLSKALNMESIESSIQKYEKEWKTTPDQSMKELIV